MSVHSLREKIWRDTRRRKRIRKTQRVKWVAVGVCVVTNWSSKVHCRIKHRSAVCVPAVVNIWRRLGFCLFDVTWPSFMTPEQLLSSVLDLVMKNWWTPHVNISVFHHNNQNQRKKTFWISSWKASFVNWQMGESQRPVQKLCEAVIFLTLQKTKEITLLLTCIFSNRGPRNVKFVLRIVPEAELYTVTLGSSFIRLSWALSSVLICILTWHRHVSMLCKHLAQSTAEVRNLSLFTHGTISFFWKANGSQKSLQLIVWGPWMHLV